MAGKGVHCIDSKMQVKSEYVFPLRRDLAQQNNVQECEKQLLPREFTSTTSKETTSSFENIPCHGMKKSENQLLKRDNQQLPDSQNQSSNHKGHCNAPVQLLQVIKEENVTSDVKETISKSHYIDIDNGFKANGSHVSLPCTSSSETSNQFCNELSSTLSEKVIHQEDLSHSLNFENIKQENERKPEMVSKQTYIESKRLKCEDKVVECKVDKHIKSINKDYLGQHKNVPHVYQQQNTASSTSLDTISDSMRLFEQVTTSSIGVQVHHDEMELIVKSEQSICDYKIKPCSVVLERLYIPKKFTQLTDVFQSQKDITHPSIVQECEKQLLPRVLSSTTSNQTKPKMVTKETYIEAKDLKCENKFGEYISDAHRKSIINDPLVQHNNVPLVSQQQNSPSCSRLDTTLDSVRLFERVTTSSKGVQVHPNDNELIVKSEKSICDYKLKSCSVVLKRLNISRKSILLTDFTVMTEQSVKPASVKLSCQSSLYKCVKCERRFYLKRRYLAHLSTHRTRNNSKQCIKSLSVLKNKYKCEQCGKGIASIGSLNRHMKLAHSVQLACKQCAKVFRHERYLSAHVELHKKGHNCQECGKAYKRVNHLKRHILQCHSASSLLACIKCGMIFRHSQLLSAHLDVHIKGFNCKKCGKGYANQKQLKNHMQTWHPKPNQLTCKPCGMMFNNKSTFFSHLEIHKRKDYNCARCGKGFTDKDCLKMHIKNTHNDSKSFTCKRCGKIFLHRETYLSHLSVHKKGFNCTKCGRGYLTKGTLNKHVREIHCPSGTFSCKQCDKVFRHKRLLTAHIDVHNKGYNCKECGWGFPNEEMLRRHTVEVHGISETFACKLCTKVFCHERLLSAHLEVHNKDYNCQECGQGYVSKGSLKTHIATHHGK